VTRTRDDLGFYYSRSFLYIRLVRLLAPCLLVGWMLGPGRLVKFGPIGLDQP
jgi:hypothetical protein